MRRLILVAVLLVPAWAIGDSELPVPSCSRPLKPPQFRSRAELDSFHNDALRYKKCIEDFVAEQEKAIQLHLRARDDAIKDWNEFVVREYR